MNDAQVLFDTLKSFKTSVNAPKSAEQLLLEYCRTVLSSVERLHFDYKEKRDTRDAIPHEDDLRNLAKAVSGFANSGGGVLIWGIENKRLAPLPITDIGQFTATLLQRATQITDPVVQGIDGEWLPSTSTLGSSGYALLYVPESSLPPHRVILTDQKNAPEKVKNHYYFRTGDSFIVATHTQLEDMFGRRPKPQLSLSTQIDVQIKDVKPMGSVHNTIYEFNVILGIQNEGRGPARAPFLAVDIQQPYGISTYGLNGNGQTGLTELTTTSKSRERRYGASANVVIHSGITHWVTLIAIGTISDLDLQNMPKLIINYQITAEGAQTIVDCKILTHTDFEKAIHQCVSS